MILDNLQNLYKYAGICHGIAAAAAFLKAMPADMACGKYSIDGEDIYAIVQHYETMHASEVLWECHDKYLDIQYIVSGEETIVWAERDRIENWNTYDEGNDCCVAEANCAGVPLALSDGQFAIFAPQDAHKPRCVRTTPSHITKVVLKVRYR